MVEIAEECLEIFLAKSGSKDRRTARNELLEMLAKATPVIIKPQYRMNQALQRQLNGSGQYRKFKDLIFVLNYDASKLIAIRSSTDVQWAVK